MKLVLATSPHVKHPAVLQCDFAPDLSVMYTFAPVGLLSLAAVVRRDCPQVQCSIYDLNRRILDGAIPMDGGIYEAIAADVLASEPDVLGFMTECDSYHHILQICEAVKALDPQCFVVLGGPHASAVAGATLRKSDAVDAIVVGEGELTLPDLLGKLGTGAPVSGAVTRSLDGGIVDGGPRNLADDLDLLPMPAYELYEPDDGEEIFLEVGRGCPFKCTFCSTAPYWKRRHRVKSPARIVHEMQKLKELYNTARVHFTHDLFTTNRVWVTRVCEALIEAGLHMTWTCSARTDTVDEPLLQLMARAGCRAIYFGVESGSERMLAEIQKAIPLERSWSAVDECRNAGITPNVGFIVGFPTEDSSSFRATFDAYEKALRVGCKPAHIFAFCPFADSAIYPTLRELSCTGHFIDLPLGEDTDLANRTRVSGDPELYGAYFRPKLAALVDDELDAIAGADEFSPLVEATLAPSLALADLKGGLAQIYSLWLGWIRSSNRERGASAYRASYGSPSQFADFLLEHLEKEPDAPQEAIAAARLFRINLAVGSMPQPTTMANHRSLAPLQALEEMHLGSRLFPRSIVASLELEIDATPALSGDWSLDYPHEPTFLVWQSTAEGAVRLLRADAAVYGLLRRLQANPTRVSDVIADTFDAMPDDATLTDPDIAFQAVRSAVRQGLVTIEDVR